MSELRYGGEADQVAEQAATPDLPSPPAELATPAGMIGWPTDQSIKPPADTSRPDAGVAWPETQDLPSQEPEVSASRIAWPTDLRTGAVGVDGSAQSEVQPVGIGTFPALASDGASKSEGTGSANQSAAAGQGTPSSHDTPNQVPRQAEPQTGDEHQPDTSHDTTLPSRDVPANTEPNTKPPEEPGTDADAGKQESVEADKRVYSEHDLQPSGRYAKIYPQELMTGPDGRHHFPGDEVGTYRLPSGQLRGERAFATDINKPATEKIALRHSIDGDPRRYETKADADESDVVMRTEVAGRDRLVSTRDTAFAACKPALDKLAEHNVMPLDKHSAANDERDRLDLAARKHLTPQERFAFSANADTVIRTNQEIKHASERVGIAGGHVVAAREFKDATLLTGGDFAKGISGTLDRVMYIDNRTGALIVMEEKGVGSKLGSRMTEDPTRADGKPHRVEQGSTDYLRHMLQNDSQLAARLDASPALRSRVNEIIKTGGTIRYLHVKAAADGTVTVADFKIDEARLKRETIILAGTDNTKRKK